MTEEKGSNSKPRKGIFIKFDPDDPNLVEILKIRNDIQVIDEELVKLKQTPEQKKAKKRVYRSSYVKKPHVVEKKEADKNNPIIIARNLRYATNPAVVKRRTELATERRGVPGKLKREHPEIWKSYCPLASAPRTRTLTEGALKRKREASAKKNVPSVSLEPKDDSMEEEGLSYPLPEPIQKEELSKKKPRLEASLVKKSNSPTEVRLVQIKKTVPPMKTTKILRNSPPPARHAIRA